MPEFWFYHLQGRSIEDVLPKLLERSLERGWHAVVQAGSDERVDALDAQLWTYRDESFLPHGTARDADAAEQPVLLTSGPDNPNGAQIRFLIENAPPPEERGGYERVVLLFDGDDPEALTHARTQWQDAKASGVAVTYLQMDDDGRWQRKA